MKNIKKIEWGLLALVVVATRGEVVAAAHIFDSDGTNDLTDGNNYTIGGDSIVINDDATNGTGKAVILTGTSTVPLNIQAGILKVGDTAASGAKTTSGATTVDSGGILEITAATAGCIAGVTEVKLGGIVKVSDSVTVPADGAGTDPFANTLQMDDGSIIQLGAGAVWGRNINVNNPS